MKPRLLVIDDEAGILEMIAGHFSVRGFEVVTASDGVEGIQLCEQAVPDLILLDLKMRDLDGDQAIPALHRLAPQAKIFVISAYQDEVMQKRIASLAVDRYFEKPVSIIELEHAVRDALKAQFSY